MGFEPRKTLVGKLPDGTDQYHYDFTGHPDFDPSKSADEQTHVMVAPSIPLTGKVTVQGTEYDLSEGWHAVPREHVDELVRAMHTAGAAAGLTPDPVAGAQPAEGPTG